MRIGAIVLKLRWHQTSFGNYVGGANELNMALNTANNVKHDSLFVVPMKEDVTENQNDGYLNQMITENFSIIVCLINDYNQVDKLGMTAYEKLHDKRNEIFKAILGWELPYAESIISYGGGELLEVTPAYLWYKYNFRYNSRILSGYPYGDYGSEDLGNGIVEKEVEIQSQTLNDVASEISKESSGDKSAGTYNGKTIEEILRDIPGPESPVAFNTIYMNLIQSPSADLPYTDELPLPDNYPDVSLPDMANWIDMTDHPDDGGYSRSFGQGFNTFKGY